MLRVTFDDVSNDEMVVMMFKLHCRRGRVRCAMMAIRDVCFGVGGVGGCLSRPKQIRRSNIILTSQQNEALQSAAAIIG